MKYRKFGGTGVEASALGFGCMRFPIQEGDAIDEAEAIRMLRHAIDNGVNYVDTAFDYHHGKSEALVGKALCGGYRQRVSLATKAPVYRFQSEGDFDSCLNQQLERLQTEQIDFYLLHTLTNSLWEDVVLKFGLLEKLKEAKRQGKIKYMGFSFHDELDIFKKIVDANDSWDFCQIQLNFVGTHYQAGLAGLEYAAAKGLGVVIMEPLLGGALAAPPAPAAALFAPGKTPVEWALDYLWSRPEVSLVLSGMSTMQQTEDNLAYAARSAPGMLSAAELEMLQGVKQAYEAVALVPCTKCGYCMPCPFGLDIPAIYAAYNKTTVAAMAQAKEQYSTVQGKADACTRCGACEAACPQHIKGGELMPKIAELFSKTK